MSALSARLLEFAHREKGRDLARTQLVLQVRERTWLENAWRVCRSLPCPAFPSRRSFGVSHLSHTDPPPPPCSLPPQLEELQESLAQEKQRHAEGDAALREQVGRVREESR